LALAACGGPAASPTPQPQQQISDGVTIELSASEQPQLNQPQEFIIRLLDSAGQPIEGASVYLDLDMPAMPMGTNQPIAEALGEGRYRTQSAYTMTGEWIITVVAKIGSTEHRATFTREVAE
jgi:nitrogen fixation protein FixH